MKMILSNEDIGKLVTISKEVKDEDSKEPIKLIYKGHVVVVNQDDFIVKLKLVDNGYNIGVTIDKNTEIEINNEEKVEIGKVEVAKLQNNPDLPNICYIGTGGTIGTHVDYTTGGVSMSRKPEEIISTTPELANIINIKNIESPLRRGSEDLGYKDWQEISKIVANQLILDDINGIIVSHGTDTLSWSSSAVAFMVENINKPVLFVGAQKSPDRASFDGSLNLICASHFIKEKIPGVFIVMHGSMDDEFCYVINATKSMKLHTSRRDAFKAVNDVPVAKVYSNGKIEYIKPKEELLKQFKEKPKLNNGFEDKVAIVKVYPNSDPKIIDWYLHNGYKGLIIEGTALGHLPTGSGGSDETFDKHKNWLPFLEKANKKKVVLIMTTQSLFGRVNDKVYANLRHVANSGVSYLDQHDMLSNVAYIKLGVALSRYKDKNDIINFMKTNITGELTTKEHPSSFDLL